MMQLKAKDGVVVGGLFCLGLFLTLGAIPMQAAEIFYVSSIGNTKNSNIYGTSIDLSGNVTSWGSHYEDIAFRLVATNPASSLSDFAVWVSANKGANTDSTGNLLRATWFAGSIVANPTYANRLGTASLNSSVVSSSFTDFMVGPSSFDSPVAVSTGGTDFFVRIWATGGNSNAGFGIKLADNAILEYASPDTPITMYNWNGTGYNATAATTNVALVPEPSAFSLLVVGLGGLVLLRRSRRTV